MRRALDTDDEAGSDRASMSSEGPTSDSEEVSMTSGEILDRSQPAGWASSGPDLDPSVRSAVELARQVPADFASFRNRAQASAEELDGAVLPDVRDMARQLAMEAQQGEAGEVCTGCDGRG
ncbi:MAG: hypothetical protein SGPRY_002873 [Prymnesium sp.]